MLNRVGYMVGRCARPARLKSKQRRKSRRQISRSLVECESCQSKDSVCRIGGCGHRGRLGPYCRSRSRWKCAAGDAIEGR